MNERGVSQADLARFLGVATGTVSCWATGKKYPRVDKMQKIASVLDVYMNEHVDDRENNQKNLPHVLPVKSEQKEKLPTNNDEQSGDKIDSAIMSIVRLLDEDGKKDILNEAVRILQQRK